MTTVPSRGHWADDCPHVLCGMRTSNLDHSPVDLLVWPWMWLIGLWLLWPHHHHIWQGVWVVITDLRHSIFFLLDTGVTFLVLMKFWGPTPLSRVCRGTALPASPNPTPRLYFRVFSYLTQSTTNTEQTKVTERNKEKGRDKAGFSE